VWKKHASAVDRHFVVRRLVQPEVNLKETSQASTESCKAPFTRYNLLSYRLSDRFDNRLDVCLHDTVGCQTGCTTGFKTGCFV